MLDMQFSMQYHVDAMLDAILMQYWVQYQMLGEVSSTGAVGLD